MDRHAYVRGRPHRALSGLVIDYGGYTETSATPVRRRQVPTGSITLIVSFGPALRLHGPAGPVVAGSFLAGLHDASVITEFVGTQRGVQVNLTPLGAFVLLGTAMDDLVNRAVGVDDLGVPALATLPGLLAETPGWPARFARLDSTFLRLRADARSLPDPEVAWAWRRLRRTGGGAGVAELAAETGWSPRQLRSRFRSQVGLTPKAAARVLRFERASRMLVPVLADGGPGTGTTATLADVAATCGYADHAHLTREFRALAGVPPTTYVAEWS